MRSPRVVNIFIEKLDEINEQEKSLIFAKEKLLRKFGWEYSSSNPLAHWMWEKIIDGKRYTLSQNDALDMERRLQERIKP